MLRVVLRLDVGFYVHVLFRFVYSSSEFINSLLNALCHDGG